MDDKYFRNKETGEVYKVEQEDIPWYKKPKVWVAIISGAILTFLAAWAGVKIYRNGVNLGPSTQIPKADAINALKKAPAPKAAEIVIDHSKMTGEMATARALGDMTGMSAQEINKRLVAKGFIERLPCGEYKLTEAGKQIGIPTVKITKADHTFSNNEYDKSIIKYILSSDELTELAQRSEIIKDLVSR